MGTPASLTEPSSSAAGLVLFHLSETPSVPRSCLGKQQSSSWRCLLSVCLSVCLQREGEPDWPGSSSVGQREQPLGRHWGEEEVLSPEPASLDSESKARTGEAGSLFRCEIPPGLSQNCYLLQGV